MKASNPEMVVIAIGGDGDMYGEGGNHFLHTIRRNPDITNIVHNNMVYGLTKGQASPTSPLGFKTPVQVDGVFEEPFNPVAVAIAQGATFVARSFSGYVDETKEIIKQAVKHKGYALVDIFQNCVSFNKVNTHKWFRENTYFLKEDYDPSDREAAMARAFEKEPYPLGILYRVEGKKTFEENLACYEKDGTPLYRRERSPSVVAKYLNELA
jgi:2-oxoglutarate ferredoxin oxidoreductase subunit beta